jgi:hypothetical protein
MGSHLHLNLLAALKRAVYSKTCRGCVVDVVSTFKVVKIKKKKKALKIYRNLIQIHRMLTMFLFLRSKKDTFLILLLLTLLQFILYRMLQNMLKLLKFPDIFDIW